MSAFTLSATARQQLRQVVADSRVASDVRRAQALLWVADGQPYRHVARELGVDRRTVYNWVAHYRERMAQPVAERVRAEAHPGRPPKQLALAKRVITKVWRHDPRRPGFRGLVWTVPMLRCCIHGKTGQWVSARTVRRALRTLRYGYKRPRYVLARRATAWRQAKGGLSAG